MNRSRAFAIADKAFKNLAPSAPGSFCALENVVIVPLHNSGKMLVVYNRTDLARLRTMCDIALARKATK